MIADNYFVKESDPRARSWIEVEVFSEDKTTCLIFFHITTPLNFILVAIRHGKPARRANTVQMHCC